MKNLIFRFRKRKKVKPYKVDTSQKGFEYVGIKLSDEQFQLIRKAVDVGFWTEDKLDKELSNMRAEVLGKLMGLALSSIWGGAKDE